MYTKVLIVEDEFLIALDMEAALHEAGYLPVGIAATVAEARACATAHAPDIALVDLHLADGLTGPQVGEELVELGINVVYVTANPSMVVDSASKALAVVEKPLSGNILLEMMAWAAAPQLSSLPAGVQPLSS